MHQCRSVHVLVVVHGEARRLCYRVARRHHPIHERRATVIRAGGAWGRRSCAVVLNQRGGDVLVWVEVICWGRLELYRK